MVTSGLEFELSLPKQQFVEGEPVPLTMTLRNTGSSVLTVNNRLVTNREDAPSAFREVTLNIVNAQSGKPAEFSLIRRIGFPEATDFIQLAPNDQVASSVDLVEEYDIGTGPYGVAGVYENTLSGPHVFDPVSGDMVEQDIGALIVQLTSNSVNFSIV